MDTKLQKERQIILSLALQEGYRKRDECQNDINQLNKKFSTVTNGGGSYKEKDKIIESIMYLQQCKEGWQETINFTREWQDELK